MKIFSKNFKHTILSLILPFGMYFIYKSFEKLTELEFYFFLFFFYFILLNIIIFFTLNKVEKITLIVENKPKYLILFEVLKYIIIVSFVFATCYWIIYDYKKQNFINVIEGNPFEIFFDFYYYSLTTFIMNNGSDIKPNTILSKFLVLSQILTSFSSIVIYLSNHKDFGNFFKQIEDRINKK